MSAAQRGEAPCAKAALKEGACPDKAADSMNRTALYHAACRGYRSVVKVLLAAGADPDLADDDGETPLITVLKNNDFRTAEMLLAAGADINLVSGRQGQSPVHWAYNMDMRDHRSERVLWLVERGANPLQKNGKGRDIFERAMDDEARDPFGVDIGSRITDYLLSHNEQLLQQKASALADEITGAVHAGLPGRIMVRPLKLKPGCQP
jgi:ankyrin repeat protein